MHHKEVHKTIMRHKVVHTTIMILLPKQTHDRFCLHHNVVVFAEQQCLHHRRYINVIIVRVAVVVSVLHFPSTRCVHKVIVQIGCIYICMCCLNGFVFVMFSSK